jgi:hypothetical protein
MSDDRAFERAMDNWLADGSDRTPLPVVDAVLLAVKTTPQERDLRIPWRTPPMSAPLRLAAGIAIVAVIGFAALTVFRPGTGPGTVSSPTPSATLVPSPSPTSLVDGARRLPITGPIEPGRYYIEKSLWSAATFSFTMPAGWSAQNGGLVKHQDDSEREITFGPAVVDTLFADPCGTNETVAIGPTAEDLIAALSELPGPEVGDPADITIGDRPARSVELTVPPSTDVATCDPPNGLQVWIDRAGNYLILGANVPARVVAMDVADGRFVLASSRRETTPSGDVAELEAILASIQFEP